MRTMPDIRSDGQTKTFPAFVRSGTVTTEEMARELQARTSFTTGDIKGLLDALAHYIGEQTAEGRAVQIDGLGTFTATLALVEGKERETEGGTKRNARSVGIRTVRFRPSRHLLSYAQEHLHLERTKPQKRTLLIAQRVERLAAALAHIAEVGLLRVADYVRLTGLPHATAAKELRTLAAEGQLGSQGRYAHKIYVKPSAKDNP